MPVRKVRRPSDIWVARDNDGMPIIIVECTYHGTIPPAVVLRNLRFDPILDCTIAERTRKPRTVHAAAVRLTAEDQELHAYFLRAMDGVVGQLSPFPSIADLARSVERVVEVFRSLSLPGSRSLQGLWAELFLISSAPSVESAVRAWHRSRRSLFDFDAGAQAIEVKSSSTGLRKHHFKLAQLQPPQERNVFVASIMLRDNPRGASIVDLWNAIEGRLSGGSELRMRLSEVIAQSIGHDWQHADDGRFDAEYARTSLAFFDARDLPRVGADAGPEISDIEFSADLSGATPLPNSTIVQNGGLLADLSP